MRAASGTYGSLYLCIIRFLKVNLVFPCSNSHEVAKYGMIEHHYRLGSAWHDCDNRWHQQFGLPDRLLQNAIKTKEHGS